MRFNSILSAEPDFQEAVGTTGLEVYRPSAHPHRRSTSVPLTRIITYQPRSVITSGQKSREISIRSTSTPFYPQEKKRQRRQTPFKISGPKLLNAPRHAPLEPLVAEHRRNGNNDTNNNFLPQLNTELEGEMGTFGVIQKYFDSQTGGPVQSPKTACHNRSPSPSLHLPTSPVPALSQSLQEPLASFPIAEFNLPVGSPPAVPERSPKRLTNPCFPINIVSTVSIDSEFDTAAKGQYSPYENEDEALSVQKQRAPNRIDVGQADRAGSSNVGKLAPQIPSHDALTATSHKALNELNFYLRNTGPSPKPQIAGRPREKKVLRIFKVKQRKSLAARVGSVEGSPQRARKQIYVPTCAQEMTTSSGAKHLGIVIKDMPGTLTSPTRPTSHSKPKRRSRHVAIAREFTEEMLNPLGSPEIERIMSGYSTPRRSVSEPVSKSPRSPRQSPKSIPVDDHPLASSREEQTRARKLRDLQRIKRKPLPAATQTGVPEVTSGGPLTPAQTPEPVHNAPIDSGHEDEGCIEADSPSEKIIRIQERVVSLQRQNTELTEALAKIVGLELEEGDLKSEDVLKACRQIRFFRTPGVK